VNKQTENAATRFVAATVARYGAASALSRARMITHEYPAKRVPQWLSRSIELLQAMQTKEPRTMTTNILTQALLARTIDEACLAIQDALGITDGGVASVVFSGIEDNEWQKMTTDERRARLAEYLATEMNYAEEK
jgi:hypothetical protein